MSRGYKVVNGDGEGHKRDKMMRLKLGERTSCVTGETGLRTWDARERRVILPVTVRESREK